MQTVDTMYSQCIFPQSTSTQSTSSQYTHQHPFSTTLLCLFRHHRYRYVVDGLQRVDNTSSIVEYEGELYNQVEVINPPAGE